MKTDDPIFVIPTHRLRDVGETILAYDEHFRRNGHRVEIMVFDDSSSANQQKYFHSLLGIDTYNEVTYVGPKEKEEFIGFLFSRLRDRKVAPIIRNLFRPSYGGNRNYSLIYTLGHLVISSDDDMRPFAWMEDSPESLQNEEVCRGKLMHCEEKGYTGKSFDIFRAFVDVLGKKVRDTPLNHDRGEWLVDSAMDLQTNRSLGLERENSLRLNAGKVDDQSIVKIAQTYRSGTNDMDALDFLSIFIQDESQKTLDDINQRYVLVNFRPTITNLNWRMDCGVAGYDNQFGLPPFFPTRLRFEDYIYRLWIQQPGIVSAHVDAAQNHCKNNYMRNPLPAEIFNEEVANLLKQKIKNSLSKIDELSISFDYEGEVSQEDSEQILDRITNLHRSIIDKIPKANPERGETLKQFASNLERSFYGFEPDFFQQNLIRIIDDVISQFKGSLEMWPTIIEIAYLKKKRDGLSKTRIDRRGLANLI